MKILLEVIAGPHQGRSLEFDRHDLLLVGRALAAQLHLLDDPHFSRHHFLLEINPPRCYLRDLGSSNGTFVNGRRVQEAYLQDGDLISGGKTKIRLSVTADAQEETIDYAVPPGIVQRARRAATERPVLTQPGPSPPRAVYAVPGYEILRPIGQGGMGVVYLARQQATGETVALKVLLPESSASERGMQMFLREVSVLRRLDHPRIVRFLEMGTAHGQCFFAMEYVETVKVSDLLAGRSEPDRMRTVCTIICQALEGLSHAHGLSFVHRDVKPSNLLVSLPGGELSVKLADFGLAKNFESAGLSGITREGQAFGTCAYMAPEQIANSRAARPAADIYAIGATMYHMLAGRYPYDFPQGKDQLRIILEDDPVPLTRSCPGVPAGVAETVHRALAKEPGDRFATAEAMRQALSPYGV